MTDDTPNAPLLASAAAELRCNVAEIAFRLAAAPEFFGSELLPVEITESWSELPLEAKAVAVLFARSLDDENERCWDYYDS